MPRGGTAIQAGGVYHLISRFVAKEWFIESAVERRVYLSLLGRAIAMTDWRCFCFAVMSSHIHLGIVAGTTRLAEWMRPMHTNFAQWINIRRQRIGAVFVRGPNVIAVKSDGAAKLINYVHCNPVRAGVVSRPRESDWTSHRAYVGFAQQPSWLDVECGLELAGITDRAALAAWVESTQIDRVQLDAVRLTPYVRPGRPASRDKTPQAGPPRPCIYG